MGLLAQASFLAAAGLTAHPSCQQTACLLCYNTAGELAGVIIWDYDNGKRSARSVLTMIGEQASVRNNEVHQVVRFLQMINPGAKARPFPSTHGAAPPLNCSVLASQVTHLFGGGEDLNIRRTV